MLCQITNCKSKPKSLGYCGKHYQRFKKFGDPEGSVRIGHNLDYCLIDNCLEHPKTKIEPLCNKHYRKRLKYGDPEYAPKKTDLAQSCSVDDCERNARKIGLCHAHYARYRKYGDVQSHIPIQEEAKGYKCNVEGCPNDRTARGYCSTHYNRLRLKGDALAHIPIKSYAPSGSGSIDPNGYKIIYINNKRISEHKYIMESYIGRTLFQDETVHHKNGVRDDNRIENLELWSSSHPPGQRVKDKLTWAYEIIDRYAPE